MKKERNLSLFPENTLFPDDPSKESIDNYEIKERVKQVYQIYAHYQEKVLGFYLPAIAIKFGVQKEWYFQQQKIKFSWIQIIMCTILREKMIKLHFIAAKDNIVK